MRLCGRGWGLVRWLVWGCIEVAGHVGSTIATDSSQKAGLAMERSQQRDGMGWNGVCEGLRVDVMCTT